MVVEQHGLREALHDYVTGMLEIHSRQPRLQHMLLEETPLPERVHQALLEAERHAAKTVAGLFRLYPEVRRAYLEHAGFMVVQTVESLTHRFAAHPDEQFISRESCCGGSGNHARRLPDMQAPLERNPVTNRILLCPPSGMFYGLPAATLWQRIPVSGVITCSASS